MIPLVIFFSAPLWANPTNEDALIVHVARKSLVAVMQNIANEIDQIKEDFPQLKKWDRAYVSADRIEYDYDGKNRCQLLIYSKGEVARNEYQAGIYLKMKAFGKKAEMLKQALLAIIERHFQKIRNLHRFS